MSTNQNLVITSEDFTAATWTPTVNCSVSSNVLANPLDGAMTADKIVEDGAVGEHGLSSFSGLYVCTSGQFYCYSIYAKADTRANITLNIAGATCAGFNLTAGTVTGVQAAVGAIVSFAADIVPLGGGWYRCFYVCKFNVTTAISVRFRMSNVATYFGVPQSYAGDGVSGLYVYGAQMVQANWPGPYVATVGAQINPTSPIRNMAPSSQNLLTYSNSFENAAWPTAGFAVTPDDVANPVDGLVNADKIVSVSGAAVLSRTMTVTRSGPITLRIWANPGTHVGCDFLLRNNTTATALISRVTSLGAGSNTSAYGFASAKSWGGGWLEMTLTALSGIVAGQQLAVYFGATGAVPAGRYFWVYEAGLTYANWPGPLCHTDALAYDFGPIRSIALSSQNLLTYSDDVTNAAWGKGNVTAPAVNQMLETVANAQHMLSRTATGLVIGTTYTWSYIATPNLGRTVAFIQLGAAYCPVDLSTGAVGAVGGGTATVQTQMLAGGKVRVWITKIAAATSEIVYCGPITGTTAAPVYSYVGDVTKGLTVESMQLVQANWPGSIQPTTTPAYDFGPIRSLS